MTTSNTYSAIALVLWMGVSWFFYLGYSNDFVAGAMFFIPIVPVLRYRNESQPEAWDFVSTALTFCYLGIGIGIHQILQHLGGLSSFAQLLLGNELIMISSNAIFVIHLLKSRVPNKAPGDQEVV